MKPWIALGWAPGARSGWGQFGLHFARTLTNRGYRVTIPGLDPSGVMPTDLPRLNRLERALPADGDGWLFMPIGNGMEERPHVEPKNPDLKIAGIIFCEDTGSIDARNLNAYDVIVAGSRWTERVLREKGVERVVLCHQGYDSRVFFPTPMATAVSENAGKYPHAHDSNAPLIFSGGKLEFRKGQDIVVEAFRRFRQTREGKDAILVTNWQNMWPATMDGIWLSGYVKGVPKVVNGKADIVSWLAKNGVPPEAVIDCGWLSQPEVAQVMRSCTVGVFPNRAESGTNLPLVEALACGLPCLVGEWTGQADVCEDVVSDGGMVAGPTPDSIPVPTGCPLYSSTDGWQEQPAEFWASALQRSGGVRPASSSAFADYWSWEVRGPAIVETVEAFRSVGA